MNRRAVRTIRRDTVLFVAGLAGVGYQQVTGKVYWELLVVFGLMLGLPGALALASLLSGADAGVTPATTGSSPSSPSPAPPPSSSSPSPR